MDRQVWTDYTVYITTCITSMKGSRHVDQQIETGGQTTTSACMKREHTVKDSYGQTGGQTVASMDEGNLKISTDCCEHGWKESGPVKIGGQTVVSMDDGNLKISTDCCEHGWRESGPVKAGRQTVVSMDEGNLDISTNRWTDCSKHGWWESGGQTDLCLRPEFLNDPFDAADHFFSHARFLWLGGHVVKEICNLMVKPANTIQPTTNFKKSLS